MTGQEFQIFRKISLTESMNEGKRRAACSVGLITCTSIISVLLNSVFIYIHIT